MTTSKAAPADDLGVDPIRLARLSIREALGLKPEADAANPRTGAYRSKRVPGVFVSLRCRGELRGCMGLVGSDKEFADQIWYSARQAAFGDPRFEPLTAQEYGDCVVEVSVLGPFRTVTQEEKQRIQEVFKPGLHGVQVKRGRRKAILLPQVASEMGWGVWEMLSGVCLKAGLEPDAWLDPQTTLELFTATIYEG